MALGAAPNNRYVFSLTPGQRNQIVLHLLNADSEAEFSGDSHTGPLKAAVAAIGVFQVPYAQVRHNVPIRFRWHKGGM